MESFKRRSSNLYKNPLSPQGSNHPRLLFGDIDVEKAVRKHATPIRAPKANELLTAGVGDYETGVDKAPKVAALLG